LLRVLITSLASDTPADAGLKETIPAPACQIVDTFAKFYRLRSP